MLYPFLGNELVIKNNRHHFQSFKKMIKRRIPDINNFKNCKSLTINKRATTKEFSDCIKHCYTGCRQSGKSGKSWKNQGPL